MLIIAMLPTDGRATDWSVKGALSETVEFNDNQFLKAMLAAGSFGAYTGIDTSLEGKSPTSVFDFDSAASYKKYWGPGIEDLQSEYISYGFKARYQHFEKSKDDREYLEASYGQQSAAFALFSTLGLPSNASGYLNQTKLLGGIDRALTLDDSVSFWARSIYTNYDPSASGIAFTDTLAAGSWKHSLNSVATFTDGTEVEYVNYDNLLNTNVVILRHLVGAELKLSPLLSVQGAIGPSYVEFDHGFGVSEIPPKFKSQSVADFVANLHVSYVLSKTATFNFEAFRTVGPDIVGTIITQSLGQAGVELAVKFILAFIYDYGLFSIVRASNDRLRHGHCAIRD